ncbi:ADP-ribosylglycohydrolase [Nakamurella silvestris]|nr:ADP-ribosylglycohydrolase [Nakamurella silvestris]
MSTTRYHTTEKTLISLLDRIHGSLAAACIADALGAPTEERSVPEIRSLFTGPVEEFYAPLPDAPYAKGRFAGQYTDDSSQMLMLAEVFIDGDGVASPEAVAKMILAWSEKPEYYPHFAGPTTRRAIDRLREGADPWEVGKAGRIMTEGSSNGGAMRIAPAGLVNPGNIEAAVRAAHLTCVPSHHTNIGVAGAGAVAAAISAAMVDGATLLDVVRAARAGAVLGDHLGAEHGRVVAGPDVARRIDIAVDAAMRSDSMESAVEEIVALIGTGLPAAEACPAAIGFFVAAGGDPWKTAVLCANAGGDSDTVGCMAAAIAGAYTGIAAVPQDKYQQMLQANELDLASVASRLTAVVNN